MKQLIEKPAPTAIFLGGGGGYDRERMTKMEMTQ